MLVRKLLACTVLSSLFQLTTLAEQNSAAAASPATEAAPFRAEIGRVEEALPKIADRGAALFMLAKLYAQLGDIPKAMSLLKECIARDEGFDPTDSPTLAPLRGNPEFQQLVEEVHRRYPPVHNAHVAFTIAETDLFPEGIVFDPANHVFYMGSMGRRKIVRITEAGKVSDFVKSDAYHLLPLGGIKVDPADHGLWAASDNDFDSELLHFNAQGKLLERFSPPGGSPHVLNDLVLQGSNNVYVTDTLAHHVYRFDRKTHSFTPLALIRPLFYPNGITLAADGNLLYVADDMGVIQVDLRNNSSHQVSPGDHSTMAGIDGLYWYKGDLLGLEYGTGSFRVVRWRLSPDGLRSTHTEVLEYRTPLVSFTTTGAIKGQELYFMANTGVGNMKDYKPIDPAKLEPLHIAVVSLTP